MRVHVLNGVNLNMLGRRDPAVYGPTTLADLETMIYEWASELGLTARCAQTNFEGEYVEMIHRACDDADGLVLNPGAWTHYSYAVRDAVEIFPGPVIEVHLSAIEQREEFRHFSVLADLAARRISGQGVDGYREALSHLAGTAA